MTIAEGRRSIVHGDVRIEFVDNAGYSAERIRSAAGTAPLRRRVLTPVPACPIVGRDREVTAAIGALRAGRPIGFYAPCGFGVSTLLRHCAWRIEADLPTEVVYLRVDETDDVGDVLHKLTREIYTSHEPVRLSEAECGAAISRAGVVVVLDDVAFGPGEVRTLLRHLSGCGVVLGSTRPTCEGEGVSYPLAGLAVDAATEVVRRSMGRPLTDGERAAMPMLTASVAGRPLRLRQVAALCADGVGPLAWLADVARRDPGELDRLSTHRLTDRSKRVLALLAFTAGMLLPRIVVEAIGDVGRVDEALAELDRRGVVDRDADRFGVSACDADSVRQQMFQYVDLAGAARSLADYLSAHDPGSEECLGAAQAAVTLVRHVAERGDWPTVARLARAAEPILALAGRWQACRRLVMCGLQAARTTGDSLTEAYFAHQYGTMALCRDELDVARRYLSTALDIRQRYGASGEARITRANLDVLTPVAVQPDPASPRRTRRPLAVAALVSAFLIAGLGVVSDLAPDRSTATPAPSVSRGDDVATGPRAGGPGLTPPAANAPGQNAPDPNPPETNPPRVTPAAPDRLDVNVSPGRPAAREQITVANPHRDRHIRVTARLAGHAAFTVDPSRCAGRRLAPGRSCPLTVTFAPTRLGAHSATLTVADQDGRAASIGLVGTGHVVLTVVVTRSGTGRVTGGSGLVDCTSQCSVRVTRTPLTLVATPIQPKPGPGSSHVPGGTPVRFLRWQSCPGSADGTACTVSPNADHVIGALFSRGIY